MAKNRMFSATASYLILEKEDQILFILRQNTGYQDGMYQVPAGHIEMGELPTEALIRESKEEVGVDIEKSDLELIHVSTRPKHDETGNRVDFFFRVRKWKGEPTNTEPDKCAGLYWFKLDELPKNVTPHIKEAILRGYRGEFFSEFDLDWMKAQPEYGLK
jgi:8-oxo-dGTP diphosphatase